MREISDDDVAPADTGRFERGREGPASVPQALTRPTTWIVQFIGDDERDVAGLALVQ